MNRLWVGMAKTSYAGLMTIALTGTSGGIGGLVLEKLGSQVSSGSLILVGRDASKLAPGFEHREAVYGDGEAMTAALLEVDTLFFVSGRESEARLDEHLSVVQAAVDAGVGRIVYLSFLGASPDATFTLGRHHFYTEEAIRKTGLRYTFLRDSLYQDYLPFMTGEDGVIRGPAGDGRLSAVSREDVAEVVAVVLKDADAAGGAETRHDGHAYDITGPEALTLSEVAEQLTAASGHPVSFHNETREEAYASRAKYNAPAFEVEGWVTSYESIGVGEMSGVSGDVELVIGRPPATFAQFLAAHPESYTHIGSQ
jgi:NAD(P)H dehydrogenase (quinone)